MSRRGFRRIWAISEGAISGVCFSRAIRFSRVLGKTFSVLSTVVCTPIFTTVFSTSDGTVRTPRFRSVFGEERTTTLSAIVCGKSVVRTLCTRSFRDSGVRAVFPNYFSGGSGYFLTTKIPRL